MVKIVKVDGYKGKKYSMDGWLRGNLNIVKEQINDRDMDMVGIVDGFEGVGKSVLAMQCGFYVDPTMTLDRVCFNADSFKEAVLKADRGQCIIYDEAITGAFNREAIQLMNIMLVKMMAQIRQKNLFMILVLPSFFDLDKNLAIWRSKFLVHCYFGKNFQRGYFRFANLDKKKEIYVLGQKLYRYPSHPDKWNFRGRFVNHYVFNEAAYRKKKANELTDQDYESISLRKIRGQRDSLVIMLTNMGFAQEHVSEFSDLLNEGLSRQMIGKILIKYRHLKEKKETLRLKSIIEKVLGSKGVEPQENGNKDREND